MEVKTQGKYIRISPIKARSVANEIRGMKAEHALHTLKFMPQKGARIISKVLKTAISDAEHNFLLDSKELVISKIMIDKGPSFKRWQPAARGSAHPIEKKTSHITVVVSGETKIKRVKKDEPKQEPVTEEKEVKEEETKVKEEGFRAQVDSKAKVDTKDKGQKGFFRRKTG